MAPSSLGLVDWVGYLDEAIGAARLAAGLEEARVIMYHRPREYRTNLYSRSSRNSPSANAVGELTLGSILNALVGFPGYTAPRFLYVWAPGMSISHP